MIKFTGLLLMGFKPKSSVKNYFHIRPAQFLYPSEKVCQLNHIKLTYSILFNKNICCFAAVSRLILVWLKSTVSMLNLLQPTNLVEQLNYLRKFCETFSFRFIYLPHLSDRKYALKKLNKGQPSFPTCGSVFWMQRIGVRAYLKTFLVPF